MVEVGADISHGALFEYGVDGRIDSQRSLYDVEGILCLGMLDFEVEKKYLARVSVYLCLYSPSTVFHSRTMRCCLCSMLIHLLITVTMMIGYVMKSGGRKKTPC